MVYAPLLLHITRLSEPPFFFLLKLHISAHKKKNPSEDCFQFNLVSDLSSILSLNMLLFSRVSEWESTAILQIKRPHIYNSKLSVREIYFILENENGICDPNSVFLAPGPGPILPIHASKTLHHYFPSCMPRLLSHLLCLKSRRCDYHYGVRSGHHFKCGSNNSIYKIYHNYI